MDRSGGEERVGHGGAPGERGRDAPEGRRPQLQADSPEGLLAAAGPRREAAAAGAGEVAASEAPGGGLAPRAARWRWLEMVFLFGVAPASLAVVSAKAVIPLLVVGAVLLLALLLADRTFDRRSLVRVAGAPAREFGRVAGIWLAAIALLTPAVALATPESFLGLPRERPRLWVAIMLFYPLLSVYPQEVIFRAFFFHRYGPILGDSARLIAVNALAFGLAHAMFRNGIAVGMTTVGGVLFAWTYARTRSLPLVSLEHALYGCFVFTVGLGEYFYTGAVGRE